MKSTSDFLKGVAAIETGRSDLLLLDHIEFNAEEFFTSVAAHGYSVVQNSEGQMSVVRQGPDVRDFSRSATVFDYHCDGLYYQHIPRYVLLVCVSPGRGLALTRFADGAKALQQLPITDYRILSKLDTVYIDRKGGQHAHRMIQGHPTTGEQILLIGSRAFARPTYSGDQIEELPGMRDIFAAGAKVHQAARDECGARAAMVTG
jgi:alpha-ketoglutarate-dependent taurine dioxygenase